MAAQIDNFIFIVVYIEFILICLSFLVMVFALILKIIFKKGGQNKSYLGKGNPGKKKRKGTKWTM